MNITIKEAAKKLGVQQYILYNFVKHKKLKIVRNPMRVNYSELSKLFKIHKRKYRKQNLKRENKPAEDLTEEQKKAVAKIKQVIAAREAGATFAEIGNTYGMKRQAAHALYKNYKDNNYYREVQSGS